MKNLSLFLISIALVFSGCKKDENDGGATLPGNKINKIHIDSNGTKWIATDNGLASFNGTTWTTYESESKLGSLEIFDIEKQTASYGDELWLATNFGAKVISYDVDAVSSATSYTKSNSQIVADEVSAIGIDTADARYFGTPLGISIFKGNKWDSYTGLYNHKEIFKQYKITAIASSSTGRVFATTLGGGISTFRYDKDTSGVDAITGATNFNKNWESGLKSNNVYAVTITDDSCQWYATDNGASYHTSSKTKLGWTRYTRKDGLVCDTVYDIAVDKSNNVWFGTHMGISKFDGTSWVTFSEKDGLVSNKVNTIAVDKDGSLWFGTDNGLSHFSNNQWTKYKK